MGGDTARQEGTASMAFKKTLKRSEGRIPLCLHCDKGKEFIGSTFQNILKQYDIQFRTARNPNIKSALVERLYRIIRERMWRYFTHKNTKRYIDVIQKIIIYAYNHTFHSEIQMKLSEINLYNAMRAR